MPCSATFRSSWVTSFSPSSRSTAITWISYEKGIQLQVSRNEFYCTACYLQIILKNLCSKIHAKNLHSIPFSCKVATIPQRVSKCSSPDRRDFYHTSSQSSKRQYKSRTEKGRFDPCTTTAKSSSATSFSFSSRITATTFN